MITWILSVVNLIKILLLIFYMNSIIHKIHLLHKIHLQYKNVFVFSTCLCPKIWRNDIPKSLCCVVSVSMTISISTSISVLLRSQLHRVQEISEVTHQMSSNIQLQRDSYFLGQNAWRQPTRSKSPKYGYIALLISPLKKTCL